MDAETDDQKRPRLTQKQAFETLAKTVIRNKVQGIEINLTSLAFPAFLLSLCLFSFSSFFLSFEHRPTFFFRLCLLYPFHFDSLFNHSLPTSENMKAFLLSYVEFGTPKDCLLVWLDEYPFRLFPPFLSVVFQRILNAQYIQKGRHARKEVANQQRLCKEKPYRQVGNK